MCLDENFVDSARVNTTPLESWIDRRLIVIIVSEGLEGSYAIPKKLCTRAAELDPPSPIGTRIHGSK